MSLGNREPRDVNESHQYRLTVVYRPARAIANSYVEGRKTSELVRDLVVSPAMGVSTLEPGVVWMRE